MNEQMIELLIGKYIDSEITPAEQQLLDTELSRNPRTRRLLEDLQSLRDRAKGLLGRELGGSCDSAQEVFAAALRSDRAERRRYVKMGRVWSIATGVAAACLLVGIGMQQGFFSEGMSGPKVGPAVEEPADSDGKRGTVVKGDGYMKMAPAGPIKVIRMDPVERRIDWYTYTDADGVQWLMESYRQRPSRRVVPAAYLEGL